jgi:hypothetical protein
MLQTIVFIVGIYVMFRCIDLGSRKKTGEPPLVTQVSAAFVFLLVGWLTFGDWLMQAARRAQIVPSAQGSKIEGETAIEKLDRLIGK